MYALQRTRTKCGVLASYKAREIDGQPVTDYLGVQGYLSPKRQNGTVASSTRLNACFAYLVGVDAVDTATDFGPTALRLTGAAEVLDEASELAQISAWASV